MKFEVSKQRGISRRRRITAASLLLVIALVSAVGRSAQADEEAPAEIARPLILINLASVDRAIARMDYIFSSIDRKDLADSVLARLANFRDLKGLDRKRPAGLMIFLQEGLIPKPLPVAYIPITNIGELIQTAATIQLKIVKSADKDDWYEIIPDNGEKQHLKLSNGYGFISNDPTTLDREFVDIEKFSAPLNNKYDLCASANLKVTPKPIKQLLLSAIRLATQTEMQRRDDEPEPGYRIRKANAESNLKFVENILQYGEELTIGAKVDPEKQRAFLDVVVRATPDTDFAEELAAGSPKPSYFGAAIDATVPLTFSISIEVNKRDRKTLQELFTMGAAEANRGFAKKPADTPQDEIPQLQSVKDIFTALEATVEEGHLDAFFQFMGETGDKFVFIGGARLVGGQRFGAGLTDILTRVKENSPDEAEINLSFDAHNEVIFHRITPNRRGRGEVRLYGDDYSFYIGTDNNAVWFAIGGKQALPTLKLALDKVEQAKGTRKKRGDNIPFQLIFNTTQWIEQQASSRPDGQPGRFGRFALEAFDKEGSDIIRLEARPIENGFRFRAQFENGWLKLLAKGLSFVVGGRPGV